MLKKLVKYGNSNALVLDKAILELLGIEEGSTIKIKTDGVSIILTPHEKVASDKVHVPLTHQQAYIDASIKEAFKKYKGIDVAEQEKLEDQLQGFIQKHQDLSLQLLQNPDFYTEVSQLAKQIDASSPEYMEAYKALRNKFSSPELISVENEIKTFESKNKLTTKNITDKQQKAMEQEFLAVHKKHSNTYHAFAELLNNPEYQHEAQLIAEKYNAHKNSADYLNAMDDLTYKYLPELRQAREELKAVAAHHEKNDTE